MSGLFVAAASFLASGVEMVEALTIVLASGLTRGWRSALLGAAAATVVLAATIAVFGVALVRDQRPSSAMRTDPAPVEMAVRRNTGSGGHAADRPR